MTPSPSPPPFVFWPVHCSHRFTFCLHPGGSHAGFFLPTSGVGGVPFCAMGSPQQAPPVVSFGVQTFFSYLFLSSDQSALGMPMHCVPHTVHTVHLSLPIFFPKKELKTQCRTKKGGRKLQIQIKKNSQSNFIEARTVCTVCCTVCTVRTMCRTLCVGIPTAGKKRRKSVLGGRGNVA